MEGHKTYLSSTAAFLTATGHTPVPIDAGSNILDRLGSLQEYAVVILFGHGNGSPDVPHKVTTGLEWDKRYANDDAFAKGNVLYEDLPGDENDVYISYVSILPEFWTSRYSSRPFGGTLFFSR